MLTRSALSATAIMTMMTLLGGCGSEPELSRSIGESCESNDACTSTLCYEGTCISPAGDEDGDGLINELELSLGTLLDDPDSDADGVNDGVEAGALESPADTDGDGVIDALESALTDSDCDGLVDEQDAEAGEPVEECGQERESCEVDCDDGNPCTDDLCEGGQCVYVNNTSACEDGVVCTKGDQCAEGVCVPGPNPAGCLQNGCADGLVCVPTTSDNCLPKRCECNESNAQWECDDSCNGGTCEPGMGIRVELRWAADPLAEGAEEAQNNPNGGSDLDLHLRHPNTDAWFDKLYDCYFKNAAPDWGATDPGVDDDPILLLDVTNEWGPELIELTVPEEGRVYTVGAHYYPAEIGLKWMGPTLASVQIYIDGTLVSTLPEGSPQGLSLVPGDLWEVATIAWPSGTVTPLSGEDGEPIVTPNVDPLEATDTDDVTEDHESDETAGTDDSAPPDPPSDGG